MPTLAVPIALSLLAGCGSVAKVQREASPTRYADSNPPAALGARAGNAARPSAAPSEPAAELGTGPSADRSVTFESDAARPAADPPRPDAADRLVFYEGACRLRAPHPREILERAIAVAEAAGGYLESRSDTAAVLRVPVAEFRPTFGAILALGVVLSRRLTATDVTDQVTDLDLRLKTLTTARDRLQHLLAKATTESQQLSLLREIDRLTMQIDQISLRLHTLQKLAAFSRISVDVVGATPAIAHRAEDDVAGLAWMRSLSPFSDVPLSRASKLDLDVPSAMVELEVDDRFRAEAADGAFIRGVRRPNEPAGSAQFWVEALEHRLAPAFSEHEVVSMGRFRGVRFVHQGDASYRYLVLVRIDDDDLELLEAYYPDAASEARHQAAVEAALDAGAASS